MTQIQHVIFDIDGVLVESEDANHFSLMNAMAKYGFVDDCSDYLRRPIPTTEKLKYLEASQAIKLTSAEREDFMTVKFASLLECMHLIRINPIAVPCIRSLIDNGITVSFASNARLDYVRIILKLLGLDAQDYLHLGNDSGLPAKPSPDMFLHTASALNLLPKQILVVDDASVNIDAAAETGFQTLEIITFNDLIRIHQQHESYYTNGRTGEPIFLRGIRESKTLN